MEFNLMGGDSDQGRFVQVRLSKTLTHCSRDIWGRSVVNRMDLSSNPGCLRIPTIQPINRLK